MNFAKPSMLSLFQLLVAFLLVAFMTSPDAMHGPMLLIKGGHGHGGGGGMGAATLLAAGLVVKLLSEIGKHKKIGGGFAGGYEMEGLGMGHGMGHGMGYGGGMGYGNGVGHSFQSHDAHLGHYGYQPQSHGMSWAK